MVKSKELDDKLEEKRALLVPVEENPDIKVIEDTIANIDAEIEALFENEAMVEEKKIQFITEHIKKIVVLSNKDVFIVLDSIAGAFLFVDKGDAKLEIVPVEGYNPEELSEVGITESEIVPFDRESMPLADGRVRDERHGKERGSGGALFYRLRRDEHRGDWESCPSRDKGQAWQGGHPHDGPRGGAAKAGGL